jgi:hypothetical protein
MHGLKGGRWGGWLTLRGLLVLGRWLESHHYGLVEDLNCNSRLLNQWPTSLHIVGLVRWSRIRLVVSSGTAVLARD